MEDRLLRAIPDGSDPNPDFAGEWRAYWSCIAEVAAEAITHVSPEHPDGAMMRSHARDARAAAGLPPAWPRQPEPPPRAAPW
jgi:hypothetical protein